MISNKEFFDHLAADYNGMINFENSLNNKISCLKRFVKPSYKYALDLGCGSGADSIALAKLGLSVDAIDQSFEMIKAAEENSKKYNTKINFYTSSITKEIIFSNIKNYDIIVSLGNTLANINGKELAELINRLRSLIAKKSKMVFQLVNYAAIPKVGEYILNKKETDKKLITRKYFINKDDIEFVIVRKNKKGGNESVIKTALFTHNKSHFVKIAEENNFKVRFFGSLSMEDYSEQKSKDLVVLLET
jgi:SAM-dependent methyltransferase